MRAPLVDCENLTTRPSGLLRVWAGIAPKFTAEAASKERASGRLRVWAGIAPVSSAMAILFRILPDEPGNSPARRDDALVP